ncbi:MAG: hypothetical protein ABR878_17610 [Roseiarcus sp.]|jgi:hypothetical protein
MRKFLTTAAVTLCIGVSAESNVSALASDGVSGAGNATGAAPFTLAEYYGKPGYGDESQYSPPEPEYRQHCYRECYRWDYYRRCIGYRRVCE